MRFGRAVLHQVTLEKDVDGRETVMIDSVSYGNTLSRYGEKSKILTQTREQTGHLLHLAHWHNLFGSQSELEKCALTLKN